MAVEVGCAVAVAIWVVVDVGCDAVIEGVEDRVGVRDRVGVKVGVGVGVGVIFDFDIAKGNPTPSPTNFHLRLPILAKLLLFILEPSPSCPKLFKPHDHKVSSLLIAKVEEASALGNFQVSDPTCVKLLESVVVPFDI